MSTSLACQASNENPLLAKEFDTPHGTIPFDRIKLEHYMPAFEYSIAAARKEIEAIANNQEQPNFKNTIEALEYSGLLLERTSSVFFNLNEAETNDQMQELAQQILPILTDFGNDIYLNHELFLRVKAVHQTTDRGTLTPEQQTLLEKTYKTFTRKGADLSPIEQAMYREVTKELAILSNTFKKNALAETNAYTLHITNEADLSGLPEAAIEQAALTAQNRGLQGWIFTLQMPSAGPFLKYADNRELRKQLYMAQSVKGNQDNEHDNKENVRQLVNLRLKLAKLLGYQTYADYVLEERMAENSTNVYHLLNNLLAAAKPCAIQEYNEVNAYAQKHGATTDVQAYDWAYYTEKLQTEKYNINEELLRPYFEVSKVTHGIFTLANKLFGLTFKENPAIPVYHPEVKVYEVYNQSGEFVAIYYADLYPREGKRSGAWMTSMVDQYRHQGKNQRPHIVNVGNFTKPTPTKPALLSFYEVNTFLHEFGHALHGMLANSTYPSLSGTNVYRDFVELPSQIMENWAVEKEFLDLFATHYETGDKISPELIDNIHQSRLYLSGYLTVRQLSFGFLDMAYHTLQQPLEGGISQFEKTVTANTNILPTINESMISTAFSHIFGGGYAAGYYSYKWAELLEADAYSVFQKQGIFDRATAQSFANNILSKGGTEHPMILYKRFRGQEPTIDALLVKAGFTK